MHERDNSVLTCHPWEYSVLPIQFSTPRITWKSAVNLMTSQNNAMVTYGTIWLTDVYVSAIALKSPSIGGWTDLYINQIYLIHNILAYFIVTYLNWEKVEATPMEKGILLNLILFDMIYRSNSVDWKRRRRWPQIVALQGAWHCTQCSLYNALWRNNALHTML